LIEDIVLSSRAQSRPTCRQGRDPSISVGMTKKSGIKINALSDSTLEDFLSGNMSVEELLNR